MDNKDLDSIKERITPTEYINSSPTCYCKFSELNFYRIHVFGGTKKGPKIAFKNIYKDYMPKQAFVPLCTNKRLPIPKLVSDELKITKDDPGKWWLGFQDHSYRTLFFFPVSDPDDTKVNIYRIPELNSDSPQFHFEKINIWPEQIMLKDDGNYADRLMIDLSSSNFLKITQFDNQLYLGKGKKPSRPMFILYYDHLRNLFYTRQPYFKGHNFVNYSNLTRPQSEV